ncbi:MAG: translocation/assembly module TamB domain-containing protein, partial [Armatimonadota bacterium]|nr:translocation/assembly module TamB domain-containing protein [Armatimonadota bacterium]
MPRLWGGLAAFLVALLALGVGGLAAVRSAAFERYGAEVVSRWLAEQLGRPVSLARVQVRAGQVTFYHVRVAGLLRADEVWVEWDPILMVRERLAGRSGVQAFRRVGLVRPVLVVVRGPQGRWNIEQLVRPPAHEAAPAERARAEVHVTGGSVQLLDLAAGGFRATLTGVEGSVRLVDLPLVRVRLAARVAPGVPGQVEVSGWVDGQQGMLDLALRFEGLATTAWANYLVADPRWRWEAGVLGGRARIYGSTRSPQVAADVRVEKAAVFLPQQRLKVQDIAGEVRVAGSWVTLRSVRLRVGSATVHVSGELRLAGGGAVDLDLRFRGADPFRWRRLVGAAFPVRGPVSGRARVEGPLAAVRVRAQLAAPRVLVGREPVQDVTAQVDYRPGTLSVASASGRLHGGRVRADAVVALDEPYRLVASARLEGVDGSMAGLLGVALPVQGPLTGAVVVAGPVRDPVVAGLLRGGPGQLFGQRVDSWTSAFEYGDGRLKLHAARARRAGAEVSAWGYVTQDALDLQVATAGLRLEDVGRAAGVAVPTSGTVDATGHLTGSPRAPRLSATARLQQGAVGPLRWDEAVLQVDASRDVLWVRDLRWQDRQDTYRAWGRVGLQDTSLRFQLHTPGARVERLLQLAEVSLPVSGELRGSVEGAGTVRAPVLQGALQLWDLRTPEVVFQRAGGRFQWQAGVLSVQEAELHSAAFDARLRGAVTASGDLRLSFSADAVRLEALRQLQNPILHLQGAVRVRGEVTGRSHEPVVRAEVTGTRLRVNGEVFDGVEGVVRWASGTLEAAPLRLRRRLATYVLEGRLQLADDPVADLALDVRDADLLTLLGVAGVSADADGRLSGRLVLSGPLSRPRAELDVQLAGGAFRGYRFSEGAGRLVLEDGRVSLEDVELVAGRGRLRAEGYVSLRGPSEVEVAGLGLEAAAVSTLARLRTPLVGTVDFTLQLSGTLESPTAGLALEARDVGAAGAQADRLTAQAIYRDGFLELEQLLLEEDGQRVRARGRLPLRLRELAADPQGPVDFVASTERADLGILRLLPFVESADGPLEASLRITGTVSSPQLEGFVRARGGRVKVAGVNPALEDLQVDLGFDHAAATLRQLRAGLGGGVVEATGDAGFEGLRLQRYRLTASARSARVEIPYFRGVVDGTAEVTGTLQRARLSGRLTLSAGELVVAASPGAGGGTALPVDLDLELVAGQGLSVAAGPVRLQVGGGLHVGGSLTGPALSGTVTGRGGEYRAFGTTFVVEEGVAVFQEFRGTEPVLSARARTRVGDVTVFVHLAGTPGQMQVRLTSDPE